MPPTKRHTNEKTTDKRPAHDDGLRIIHIPRSALVGNPFRLISRPPRLQGPSTRVDEPDDEDADDE